MVANSHPGGIMEPTSMKAHFFDACMVVCGAVYTVVAASLPVIIGLLTAALFIVRLLSAHEELLGKRLQNKLLQAQIDAVKK